MAKYYVIIPCAGSGSRFAAALPKQYQPLLGKTVLAWTLAAFQQVALIEQIILVVNANDKYIDTCAINSAKLKIIKAGGESRAQSVSNGLRQISGQADDWVLVHDAARCCITASEIQHLIKVVGDSCSGGILAQAATDTIKYSQNQLHISTTLQRQHIFMAQTPQMFRLALLQQALAAAAGDVTDEASAVEQLGVAVQLVAGSRQNIKLTYPEDIRLAEIILSARANS